MKKSGFLFLFLISFPFAGVTASDPGTQTIRGRVISKDTGLPLTGATILLLQTLKPTGTVTDQNGKFRLEKVPTGRISLKISFLGYESQILSDLMLKSGKELVLEIELRESAIELTGIEVTYSKNLPINDLATVSNRTFSAEETEKYAGSWGDPARMASNFAGAFTAGDQRNDIIIRGNAPTGVLWLLEDIPVPSPNHFDVMGTNGGPICMLNNNLLARSEFFTSAFPAGYGNALSGVFDLKLRSGNPEKREYLGQIGFNGIELGTEGPISPETNSSYLIHYRYSALGLIKKLLWVDGLPDYSDLSFKLNFPGDRGKFSVFGLGGISRISLTEEDDNRVSASGPVSLNETSGSETGVLGVSYVRFLSEATSFRTGAAVTTRHPFESADSLVNGETYLALTRNSYRQNNVVVTGSITHRVNPENTLHSGLSADLMAFRSARMTNDDESGKLIIDRPYETSARGLILWQAFTQWKHEFNPDWVLSAGLHGLYFTLNQSWALDPRLGVTWKFSENQSFGAGYGQHSQTLPVNVYFVRSRVGFDADGRQLYSAESTNKNLDIQTSHHFAVSHDFFFTEVLHLKTEIYHQELFRIPVKNQKGYFSLINQGAAMSVADEDSLVSKGRGRNTGIEFTLEKNWAGRTFYLVTLSLFNSAYQGADGNWRSTVYNGNYILNLLAGWESEKTGQFQFSAGSRMVLAGGRRLIPFDLQQSVLENRTVYLYDQAYEKQADPYFRFDARAGLIFHQDFATHELALDVVNLTNHRNVYREKFSSETGKKKVTYQQGIFPVLLYRLNF